MHTEAFDACRAILVSHKILLLITIDLHTSAHMTSFISELDA